MNHNNTLWSKRDALLILLDEFDVIRDKTGLGSLIKSLTSPTIKFAVCGIGSDLSSLVTDHASVGRLIQQGSLHVEPMEQSEVTEIFATARTLFKNQVEFAPAIVEEIANLCEGYPYFAQLIGKACVEQGNRAGTNVIDTKILRVRSRRDPNWQGISDTGTRLQSSGRPFCGQGLAVGPFGGAIRE